MDPRKRNPSRSPEGGPSRKQKKPASWQKNGAAPRSNSESLRSSPSNSTPRRANPGATSPQGRDKESLNGDHPSGRSTPHIRALNRANPNSVAGAVNHEETEGNIKAVREILQSFSTQVAEQSALQVVKVQAENKVERLQREYNANRNKYKDFPVIAERKAADKEAATKDLEAKKERLQKHQESHQDLMGSLATFIGQIAAAKPPIEPSVERTDVVSREEFQQLEAAHKSLRKQVEQHQDANAALREANNGLSEELSRVKAIANKASDDAEDQSKRIESVASAADSTRQHMDKLMSEDLKSKIEKIADEGPVLVQTVARHSEIVTRLEMDIEKLKENPVATAVGPDVDLEPVFERLSRVEEDFKTVQDQQELKDALVEEEIQNQVGTLQEQINEIRSGLGGFKQTLDAAGVEMASKASTTRLQELRTELVSANNDIAAKQSEHIRTIQTSVQTVEMLKEGTSKLAEEVRGLQVWREKQRNTSQTPTPVSPAQPQFTAPTQAHPIANGIVSSSPQINGVQAPQRNAPYGNGVVQAPPPPNVVAQELERFQKQMDVLVHVTGQLKMRMDNMTTDEVVRQMSDQMSQMYPDAKNFQGVVWRMGQTEHESKAAIGRVNELQSAVKQAQNKAESAHTKAEITKQDMEKVKAAATSANETANNLAKELKTMKERADRFMFGDPPKASNGGSSNLVVEVDDLKSRMDAVEDEVETVRKAEQTNESRLTTLVDDWPKVAQLEDLGKQRFDRLDGDMNTLTIQVGSLTGRVSALENHL